MTLTENLFLDIKAEMIRRCYGNKAPENLNKRVRFALLDQQQPYSLEEYLSNSPNIYTSEQHHRAKTTSSLDLNKQIN